jgi:ankyrin repeat protein
MEKLIQKLKELMGDVDLSSFYNNENVLAVSEALSVSLPTIKRWYTGVSAPHRAMLPMTYEAIDKLIKEKAPSSSG